MKPTNNYGLFKSQVEKFIISSSKNYACILRLTKVISNKSSFILNWEKDLKEKGYCKVFKNKLFSPVSHQDIYFAVIRCIKFRSFGVFQLGGNLEISYLDFAKKIFKDDHSKLKTLKLLILIIKQIFFIIR